MKAERSIQRWQRSVYGKIRKIWTISKPESSKIVAALPLVHTPIDDLDLQIASIALEHDLPLATNNTKHFKRVNDLRLENWIG